MNINFVEITGSLNAILLWPKCINTPWDGSFNWSHGLLIFPYNSLKFPCSWNGSLRLISVNYQQWKRITWPSNDSQQLICSKWNTNNNKIEEVLFNKSKKKLQFFLFSFYCYLCFIWLESVFGYHLRIKWFIFVTMSKHKLISRVNFRNIKTSRSYKEKLKAQGCQVCN